MSPARSGQDRQLSEFHQFLQGLTGTIDSLGRFDVLYLFLRNMAA
jgi:hypothetical protein